MENRPEKTKKTSSESQEKVKFHMLAVLSYVPLLCFITFFSFDKLDQFSKQHAKQGMILLFIEVISLLFLIDFVSKLFWILILIVCILLSIVGVFKSLIRQDFQVPFLGKLLEKYDI